MEKPYTKEQLLEGIKAIDKYLDEAKPLYEEIKGLDVPSDLIDEYDLVQKQIRSMQNIRILFVRDLFCNHGIFVESRESLLK